MNRSKRRIVIIVLLVIIVLIGVVLFLNRSKKSGVATVSDIILNNVSGASSLSNRENITFFTGTSIASVDIRKSISSTVKTKDIPFTEVYSHDYREDDGTLLAQVNYTPEDLYIINGIKKPVSGPIQVWITQQGNGEPVLFDPFNGSQAILDAKFFKDGVALLASDGLNTNLYYYTDSLKELASGVSDTQIVGFTSSEIIGRNAQGKTTVYGVDNSSRRELPTGFEQVLVDRVSNSIITQDANKKTVLNSREGNKELKVSNPHIFISKGYVVSIDKLISPTKMGVTNLQTNEEQLYDLEFLNPDIEETISGVVMIDANKPLIAFETEYGYMILVSIDKNQLSSYKEYQFPSFKDSDFVTYDIGTNTATIYSKDIAGSIQRLKNDCTCDVNQFKKFWLTSENSTYITDPGEPEELEEADF